MRQSKRNLLFIALITSALILAGCAGTKTKIDETTAKISELQQRFVKSMRKPGENMVSSPEKTSENYSCSPYKRTTLILEKAEVIPTIVSPDEEINQRIRYAMCPYTPSGTVYGKIIRKVLFKGAPVFQDIANYEFKPGTWTVDAFIEVPYDAQSGIYSLEITLAYNQRTIMKSNTFIVKSKQRDM